MEHVIKAAGGTATDNAEVTDDDVDSRVEIHNSLQILQSCCLYHDAGDEADFFSVNELGPT